jgi:hypothetical protein
MTPEKEQPMRNLLCGIAVFLLVLSLGCGNSEDEVAEKALEQTIETQDDGEAGVDITSDGMEVTSTDADGTYTWQAGSEAELPEGFPTDIYIPDGAVVEMSSASPNGYVLTLSTDKAFSAVVESYKEKMVAAGWTEHTATQMEGTQMLIYGQGDRSVNVGVFNEEGATKISLSVSQ